MNLFNKYLILRKIIMINKYDTFLYESCKDITDILNITETYDLFISAYNKEEMVRDVFEQINAKEKIWLLFPDYNLDKKDIAYDQDYIFSLKQEMTDTRLEMNFINKFINEYDLIEQYKGKKIAIDITGFVKPYMFYLILVLKNSFNKFDIIYTEPNIYLNHEDTKFSNDSATFTRSINGYDTKSEQNKDDLLIINAGYDYTLVSRIAENKKSIKNNKILIGFPSLQPIMYQENILNFKKIADELDIHASEFNPLFAPANDPFETANVVDKYVEEYIITHPNISTIYLAPLATKAQALGIQLFAIYEKEKYELEGIDIKIIYPFTNGYAKDSGKNLFRINKYTLEF